MGLWDLLNKDISFSRADLKWGEPLIYRLRLKQDLAWRVVLVLGCWLAATGVMMIIFSQNQNEESSGLAWGLGIVLGVLPSAAFCFFRRDDVGGQVVIMNGKVEVHRTYIGLTAQWKQTTTWDLHAPDCYHICPSEKLGHNFHVVFCKLSGIWELIGVPESIDLKKLSAVLAAGGSEIKVASKIPEKFRKRYSPALAGGLGSAGAALFVVGFLMFQPEAEVRRPIEIADIPQPEFPETQTFNHFSEMNPQRENPPPSQNLPPENSALPPKNSIPTPNSSITPGSQPAFSGPQIPRPSTLQPPDSTEPKKANLSPSTVAASDNDVGTRSDLVGGKGGFPFTLVSSQQNPVLGVRVRMGSWAGKEHIRKIEPLFETPRKTPGTTVLMAKDGYALGAVEINAPEFVDGLKLVFMKLTPGGLDSSDTDESEWIGIPAENPERLEIDGKAIIGFHGKGGAVMDAVGVVFED